MASRTESFRLQHVKIVEAVNELDTLLVADKLKVDAQAANLAISTLAGRLKIHLAMEDQSLYPTMAASKDATTKSMAEKFIKEMGSIATAFTDYTVKWKTSTIKEGPDAFIKETKGIFKVLADRVKREEGELYPLADKI